MLTQDMKRGQYPVLDTASADRETLAAQRVERPLIRVWDGNWNLRAPLVGEISGQAWRRSNEVGEIEIVIGSDHFLWDWFMDRRNAKTGQNTFLTFDKDGARISGVVDEIHFTKDKNGQKICRIHALDDIEQLKAIRLWSNPVLPAAIQFPRVFMLAGPAKWALKTTIFLNLMRLQNSLWTIPDDPLDFYSWGANLGMKNWPIVIKGGAWHLDSSPHAIVSSRFKTAFDVAKPICDDAGLEITYQRWLPGDPEPWPGHTPHPGQLVFDIVDKSLRWGTHGSGGNILHGIVNTAIRLADDLVEEDRTVVDDPDTGRDITQAGTRTGVPWVVFRESEYSGVDTSDYSWRPPTHTRLTVGGHSMAGVNETISSAVQLAGDLMSSTFIGPNVNLGQIADTFLKPLYTDTILAWMSLKLHQRAQRLGWSYLFEYMPGDSDRAYQLSSVLAMRRAYMDTGEKITHSISIADGAPYFVGRDFWVGDRVASEPPGCPEGALLVDKCSEAGFEWDRSGAGWRITIGDVSRDGTGWDRIIGRISNLATALHDQGVL